MSVAAVVVSFNVRDRLSRCLASLEGADELVVVDNASTDDSTELVRESFAHAELVALEENVGFSTAVNRGVRCTRAETVLLLNPDAALTTPVGAIESSLTSHPGAWAVGFRQVDVDDRFQLAVGPPPSLVLDLVRGVAQRALDRGNGWVGGMLDRVLSRPMPVPWVAGSSMAVRRDAFERIGGFDEKFFLYFEDIDFCLRLRRAGGGVWYDPTVTVVHERGVSASRSATAHRAYRQSQLYFWEKHRGKWAREIVDRYQRWRGVSPEE